MIFIKTLAKKLAFFTFSFFIQFYSPYFFILIFIKQTLLSVLISYLIRTWNVLKCGSTFHVR